MAGAINYMPKGVPVSVVGYWRPNTGAVVGSDMITSSAGAKNPVLAHHFLNYLLDNKHGVANFSWLGYMPPLTVINPDKVIAQGYIPKNLGSTVVRESDFENGVSILPLTAQGQATWQNAWSTLQGRLADRQDSGDSSGRASRSRARSGSSCSSSSRRTPSRGGVRHDRPDLLEPGAGVEPAALAVRHDAQRAARPRPGQPFFIVFVRTFDYVGTVARRLPR